LLTVELSQKLVENELLGQEISLADVDKQHRRSIQPATRKRSPSPLNEQYNTSSFEEDFNSESRISRSEDDDNLFQQKKPMEGTGRFTANAFERQILPPRRRSVFIFVIISNAERHHHQTNNHSLEQNKFDSRGNQSVFRW